MIDSLMAARFAAQNTEREIKARLNMVISAGTMLIMLLFLVLIVIFSPSPAGIAIFGGLLLTSIAAYVLNARGHISLASWIFLLGYSLLFMLAMFVDPSVNSTTPYFLAVPVVLSSGLLRPATSFALAAVGTLAIAVMVNLALPLDSTVLLPWVGAVLVPAALLFLLAAVSWLYGSMTNQMLAHLRGLAHETRETVNVLTMSASEIQAATLQAISGITETATAVNQITSTIDEIKLAVRLSAEKAKQVSERAQQSAETAQTGNQVVVATIGGMQRIREQMDSIVESIVLLSEQSQAIGEIMVSVNDLAEQANLLAVNAAIEASRAGEHGKGFVVVAQEIKNMAEQSKQATSQVRAILRDIQKATSAAVMVTDQGNKEVGAVAEQSVEAGETIRKLTENLAEAAQAAVQISASSQQQMAGVEQVAAAMQNIKQASLENTTSTEQVGSAAEDLQALSQKLKQLVAQLNV